MRDFTINSREDISAFFTYLMQDLKLIFHPDNAFADYVSPNNSITFTLEEADHLEKILEMCFDWCFRNDEDIYHIGLETCISISTDFCLPSSNDVNVRNDEE